LNHSYLTLTKEDIKTERSQCEQEGRDLSSVEDDFAAVLDLDLENPRSQAAALVLLDKTIRLPQKPDYQYLEPSDLQGIRAARPADRPTLPPLSLSDGELEDKLHGAWTGRCVGCLLGKPVEGWLSSRMWPYLKESGRWPLNDFFRYGDATPAQREKYNIKERGDFADRISGMPEDDDTNYTVTGLAIMKKYGPGFTPKQVAEFWLDNIPVLHTCTAERIAYKNLCLQIPPPESAAYRNPYREWIGAQIRADFWGYASAGNPELAAEFAWRDASVSHVKNGIFGEMWAAAMIAAAFVTDDIPTIIRAGLAQIPERSRLADYIESVLEWHEIEVDYDTSVRRVHEMWDETTGHAWCHTISNAMIVAIALLYGEGDYGRSICRAVQPCFDTDCNGATVGSILGIIHGRKALPSKWVEVIEDTLHTGVAGYHTVNLSNISRETLEIVKQVAGR
jgi:ADP-ribosylglycohydrolase